MKRRELLQGLGMLGVASLLPISVSVAAEASQDIENTGFYSFTLGQLEILIVSDGHMVLSPIQPIIAPLASPTTIKETLADAFLPTDQLDLGFNVLVIKKGKQIILMDTGCGVIYGSQAGKLPANLKAAGINVSEVTDIVLTHAHTDHLGGLLNSAGKLTFPNAKIHISKDEHDFWTSPNPDFSKNKLSGEKIASMIKHATEKLAAVKDRIHLFKDGDILFECLRMELAPGHTPGHCISYIFSGTEELVHLADIVHTHVLLVNHPEWGNSFDTDFNLAIETRQAMLKKMALSRKRTFSYHLPWPGIGYIRKKNEGYDWIQEVYSTPQLV